MTQETSELYNVLTSSTTIPSNSEEEKDDKTNDTSGEDKEEDTEQESGKEKEPETPLTTVFNEWEQSSRANEGFDPQLVRRVIQKKKFQKSLQQKATERAKQTLAHLSNLPLHKNM